MIRLRAAVVVLGLLSTVPLAGQDSVRRPQGGRRQLEQRFRERFAAVVQDKVQLSDDQMTKLAQTNQRFETRRRDLLRRERDARMGLREELMGAATPNEDRVRQLLEDALRLQREKADLLAEEHADMGRYMSPSQRARFFGIQEQMRRRVEEMRPPEALSGPDSMRRSMRREPPLRHPGLRRRPGMPR